MRMMMTLLCLGLWFAAGCSDAEGDCKDICAQGNACSADDGDNIECDEFCKGVATINKTDCGRDYDDLVACEKENDVCEQDACKDQFNAYGACVLLYCGSDFDEPGCDEIRDGLSS